MKDEVLQQTLFQKLTAADVGLPMEARDVVKTHRRKLIKIA
jgi:hypothetical protein